MKSVFHNNPGREKYAKQGCLGLIIPYSQYQQRQSAHRRKDPNHYVIYRFLLIWKNKNKTELQILQSGWFLTNRSFVKNLVDFLVTLIRIYSPITSDSIRGLVRHFSVNQLNKLLLTMCEWTYAAAWPFFFRACCLFRYVRLCSMPRSFPS